MVYRRKTYRKKRYYRKGSKLNPRQKREVKRLIGNNLEKKISDTVSTGIIPGTSPTLLGPFTAINQGIADNQRVGDAIKIQSLRFNTNITVADTANFVRYLIFQWLPNNATVTPTIGAILEQATIQGQHNHTNVGHLFNMLFDRTYTMSQTGSNAAMVRNFSIYGKRLRKIVEYNPTATTGFYHVYMFVLSDSSLAPNPVCNMVTRLTYTDA